MTVLNLPTSILNAAGQSQQVSLGNVSGNIACNLALGGVFLGTITGSITGVTFTNWPANPTLAEPLLILTQDGTGGHSISFPSVTWLPLGSNPTFDTVAGHVNYIPLSSPNQGATIFGETSGGGSGVTGLSPAGIDISTGGVQISITTDFGIQASNGLPYYDTSGATQGEDASIMVDPTTGLLAWNLIGGQIS